MALNKTHSVIFRRNAFCEIIHFTVFPNGELRGVRINTGSAISVCLSLTDAKVRPHSARVNNAARKSSVRLLYIKRGNELAAKCGRTFP